MTTDIMAPVDAAHARLSPSAAKRWSHCVASIRLSEGIEDVSSEFAKEGTILHNLSAELLGLSRVHWAKWPGKVYEGLEIDQERIDAVRTYVDFVRTTHKALGGQLLVEKRVHMRSVHPTDCWGTSDANMISADGRTLHVVDAKFGRGIPVSAEGNEQMVLYAIGALELFEGLEDVRVIRMTIVQPRLDNISTVELLREDLMEWRVRLSAAALEVDVDTGLRTAQPQTGEWCKFCPAMSKCPAQERRALELAETVFRVVEATPDMLAHVLEKADQVEDFLNAVRAEAFRRTTEGRMPGYKIVAGRGSRVWTDEAAARGYLLQRLGDAALTPQELISVAQAEKVCKGAATEFPKDLVRNVSGRPTLAKESDKRQAIALDAQAHARRVFAATEVQDL